MSIFELRSLQNLFFGLLESAGDDFIANIFQSVTKNGGINSNIRFREHECEGQRRRKLLELCLNAPEAFKSDIGYVTQKRYFLSVEPFKHWSLKNREETKINR